MISLWKQPLQSEVISHSEGSPFIWKHIIKPNMPPIPIYISWQTDAILMFIYKSRLTENIQIHGLLHSKQEILPWAISAHAQVGGWASLKLKSYNCPVSLNHFTGEEVREHLTATLRQIFLYKSSFWLSKWEWKAWTDIFPHIFTTEMFLNIQLKKLSITQNMY